MVKFLSVLIAAWACFVLLVSAPVFVLYGLAEALTRLCEWAINGLANNPITTYLVLKKTYFVVKSEENAQKTAENAQNDAEN